MPANVIAGVHSIVSEPPGVLTAGLIAVNAAGLLAVSGMVLRLRIRPERPPPGLVRSAWIGDFAVSPPTRSTPGHVSL